MAPQHQLLISLVITSCLIWNPTKSNLIPEESLSFEAAFQGECQTDNVCQQECYDLHDGTFECGCKQSYILADDGYSCIEEGSVVQREVKIQKKLKLNYRKINSKKSQEISSSSSSSFSSPRRKSVIRNNTNNSVMCRVVCYDTIPVPNP